MPIFGTYVILFGIGCELMEIYDWYQTQGILISVNFIAKTMRTCQVLFKDLISLIIGHHCVALHPKQIH